MTKIPEHIPSPGKKKFASERVKESADTQKVQEWRYDLLLVRVGDS